MLDKEKMVVVKTCNELFEAEVVVGRLKAEGDLDKGLQFTDLMRQAIKTDKAELSK